MERQRQYDQRVIARPGQVRGANVVGPPAGHDWADNLLKTVAGAGSNIMRIIAHDYDRNENALMQEALINADTKFESWKQDYMKEHQGQSALDAQRDFVRKYGEIRQETMDMFGGHENEIFRQRLDQSLGMRALHALQTGGAYQEQQAEIWQKSVFDGVMANFERDVQSNPDNEQYIAARRAEVIQDMQTRFRGEDLTARIAKLDESIMEGRFNSMLASGDLAGAGAFLGKSRQMGAPLQSGDLPKGAGGNAGANELGKPSSLQAKLNARLETARSLAREQARKSSLNGFLEQTREETFSDRLALAREIYWTDQEMLAAANLGIEAEERARIYIGMEEEREREQALYAKLQVFSKLPAAEGWRQSRALIGQLPLDQREKYYRAIDNLRERSDPAAD